MKRQYYLPFILIVIIAILCLILAIRGCDGPEVQAPFIPPFNHDSAMKSVREEVMKQSLIKDTVLKFEAAKVKYVIKWRAVRKDSLLPCPDKLLVADTTIEAYECLVSTLKDLVRVDSSIIAKQQGVISGDSMNYKAMEAHKDSIIATIGRKRFWKGFKVGFVAGNVTGALVVWEVRR